MTGSAPVPRDKIIQNIVFVLLLGLLLVSLALRLYGIDWDQGFSWSPHPDERAILMKVEGGLSFPWPPDLGQLLDPETSPLNPRWFPYGSLPLYLLKLVAHFLSYLKESLASQDLHLVGRAMSALFDTATVLVVFLLGRRLYGRGVGLLASTLVAFTVLHVQLSHFLAVDVMLALFVTLALFFSARVMQHGHRGSAALAGLCLGLALATKVSAFPLLFPLIIGCALYCFEGNSTSSFSRGRLKRAFGCLLIILVVAAFTFALTEPYAIIDRDRFWADSVEQSEMVRRIRDYPYTRQYVDTPPYLYHIQQLTVWGMGLPLGIVAWGGLIFTIAIALARRRKADLLLLAWVLPYFGLMGSFQVKFMRYMLPLTPLLCLMGARMLLSWHDWARGKRWWRLSARAVIGIIVAWSVFYSLAYVNIYSQPHTAVQVSRWINENVAPGAHILKEHWEESLPDLGDYQQSELNLYDPDDPSKLDHVVEQLREADYIVLFSNRLYGTIPRLRERYPITTRYYELLFSGELGFELAHFATSYPNLMGISFVDDTFRRPGLPEPAALANYSPTAISIGWGYADESFTVYDHPKVMLFEKVEDFNEAELGALLTSTPEMEGGLLLSEADAEANQAGGTWSELFDRQGLGNRFPVVAWLLVVQCFSLAALPLTIIICRSLSDRGYLLAKTLGILLVAYLCWLMASLHVLTFSRGTIVVAWVVVFFVSVCFSVRYGKEVMAFLRERWRLILISEAVFLVAFFLFYAIRLWNPDLWHPWRGGEKPMDFAYLNAVIKTTYLPPYDPWFSGGYLNYYYFGQFIVATLVKLTGIVPAVAYNLAVPLLFALTVANAFSVVYNLAEGRRESVRGKWRVLSSSLLAGLAGALFVVVLGNMDGLVQLGSGLWRWLVAGNALPPFDYWRSSRMMPPTISITEFPYFTFLFADLHAHLIALPFTIMAVALALSLVLGGRRKHRNCACEPVLSSWRRNTFLHNVAQLVVLSLSLGALRWINSWDFPTYFVLCAAAVVISEYCKRRRIEAALFGWAILKLGIVYSLSMLLYLPFHQSFELFYSGVDPSREKTPLHQYLAVHGLFVFILLSFLIREMLRSTRGSGSIRLLSLARQHWRHLSHLVSLCRHFIRYFFARSILALFCAVAVVLLLLTLFLSQTTLVALLATVLLAVLLLVVWDVFSHRLAMPINLFVLALIGLGVCLGIGVELVTIKGDINRMNTVFKFYLQGWVLFGLASAYGLWRFMREVVVRKGGRLWSVALRWLWLFALTFLLLSSLIYPVVATPARAKDRFVLLPLTNDGMAYMKEANYHDTEGEMELIWDYEAITWLQDNIQGSPVILEGVTPLYRWGSRISVYTGLPTIVGWDWHQKQQRWGYQWMVEERLRDVRTIYSSTDPRSAMDLLRKYDVRYIYVGQLERLYYPEAGLAKFGAMEADTLEVVYQNQEVRIYKVKEEGQNGPL